MANDSPNGLRFTQIPPEVGDAFHASHGTARGIKFWQGSHVRNYLNIFSTEPMGLFGDPAGVDPLIGALRDPNFSVVHEGAEALGTIGDRRALAALTALRKWWPRRPRDYQKRRGRAAVRQAIRRIAAHHFRILD